MVLIYVNNKKIFFSVLLTGEFNFRSNHTPVSSIAENSIISQYALLTQRVLSNKLQAEVLIPFQLGAYI